jgi:hypothetical protein
VYLRQPEFLHFSVFSGLLLAISAKYLEQRKLQIMHSCYSKRKRICKQKDFHPSKFQMMQHWNVQFKMPVNVMVNMKFGQSLYDIKVMYHPSMGCFYTGSNKIEERSYVVRKLDRRKELCSQKVR